MYNINYITLDQLMASVEQDLEIYATENMIDRQRLIKVVKEVNADLGIKINKEQEVLLEIKNKKVELPLDFRYLQAIFLCEAIETKLVPSLSADHVEQLMVEKGYETTKCNGLVKICPVGSFETTCGSCYFSAKKQGSLEETQYKITSPVKLTQRSLSACNTGKCFGHSNKNTFEIDITDGTLYTNFESGTLYINYLSDMVDENNNILIMDHPLVRPYYEYAVKKRLFENWYFTNDADVSDKLKYVIGLLKDARLEAHNYVNGIGFNEIVSHFNKKRQSFLNKYVNMFGTNVR